MLYAASLRSKYKILLCCLDFIFIIYEKFCCNNSKETSRHYFITKSIANFFTVDHTKNKYKWCIGGENMKVLLSLSLKCEVCLMQNKLKNI